VNKDENLTPEEAVNRIETAISEKTKGFVTSDDITDLKADLKAVKELAEKDNTAELKTSIANLEGQITSLKETSKTTVKSTNLGEAITESYKNNIDKIKEVVGKGGGMVNLDVKAAGTMTITGNYSGGTVGLSTLETGLNRIVRRRPFLRELINVAGTTSKYVVWIEQANADGGADMTAEGAAKSQADFDLVEKSCEVKKISAWIKVSKEMIADIPFMEGEINNELLELVQLKLDEQILSGSGVGNNLTGLAANATAWAAGNFANTIVSANNSDVLRVGMAQMANANFNPSHILMNPEDVAAMELTKTTTGEYTYPMFVPAADGITRVKGVPVVENSGVAAGSFYIIDASKSNLRVREDMNIQVGFVNDDFTKNLVTILCEARACHFVKTNDYGAIIDGEFSTAKTALEA
jgi:HK97 family phage major capsid protein|tara:strand:- start:20758 stop:21987 length:1230 start_codon:yes stop_codon:yes gene_type:complete